MTTAVTEPAYDETKSEGFSFLKGKKKSTYRAYFFVACCFATHIKSKSQFQRAKKQWKTANKVCWDKSF